jgi:hydrogenase/urease accessory protein HupE
MFALLAVWLALLGGAHPDSRSSSRLVVQGERIELELACQALSLIESVPLDADNDLWVSEAELQAAREQLGSYLLAHYSLSASREPFAPLAGVLEGLELRQDTSGPFAEQRIASRFVFRAPALERGLCVRVSLFRERNPQHRDVASIEWNGEPPVGFLFAEGRDEWLFEPLAQRRRSVFADYLAMGAEHIATGYDHLAFLLALIVAARRLRSLAGVVTAFTAAHSITLACAALGWFEVPARLVELAIALSIAYVGAETLLLRRPGARWIEAFGFGLIHGLGFAGFLAESLIAEPLKVTALVGFNLGVELGQLGAVLVAALVLRWLPGDRAFEEQPRGWFAPRWLRIGGSAIVLVCGLYWFAQRAGWI